MQRQGSNQKEQLGPSGGSERSSTAMSIYETAADESGGGGGGDSLVIPDYGGTDDAPKKAEGFGDGGGGGASATWGSGPTPAPGPQAPHSVFSRSSARRQCRWLWAASTRKPRSALQQRR